MVDFSRSVAGVLEPEEIGRQLERALVARWGEAPRLVLAAREGRAAQRVEAHLDVGARARAGGHRGALRRLASAAAPRGGDDGCAQRQGPAGRALSRRPPARSTAGLGRDRVRSAGGRRRTRAQRTRVGPRAALGARGAGGDGARGRLAGAGGDPLAPRFRGARRVAAARSRGASGLRGRRPPGLHRGGDRRRRARRAGHGLQLFANRDLARRRRDRAARRRAHPVARCAFGRRFERAPGRARSLAAAAGDPPAVGRDRAPVGAEDRRLSAHRAHRRRRHGRGLPRRQRARRHAGRGEDSLPRADRRSDRAQAPRIRGRNRRRDRASGHRPPARARRARRPALSRDGAARRATRWRSA